MYEARRRVPLPLKLNISIIPLFPNFRNNALSYSPNPRAHLLALLIVYRVSGGSFRMQRPPSHIKDLRPPCPGGTHLHKPPQVTGTKRKSCAEGMISRPPPFSCCHLSRRLPQREAQRKELLSRNYVTAVGETGWGGSARILRRQKR